ncbi:hypothetical protein DPX39_040029000 [Trypanosoma brucei equiperdum]|uniref:Uncharacterized protein n=1 Tax=Trypanosoma brucei equiperdum TaxID=630700 RepID=A0A3L6L9U7_9TRYP|nr:hypothetical protein DPX39_040029000 [Trypanosoma brucei equiperdum]
MHSVNPYLSAMSFKSTDSRFEVTLPPSHCEALQGINRQEKPKTTTVPQTNHPLPLSDYAQPIVRKAGLVKASTSSVVSQFRAEGSVMEPVHALHTCIRHFLSHPDVYGSDVRAMLDRELMYVMRVKASESALLTSTTVPVSSVSLPSIANTVPENNKVGTSFLGKCSNWVVTPRSVDAAVNLDAAFGPNGMFGLGSAKLVDGSTGLFSLLERNRNLLTIQERQLPMEDGEEKGSPSTMSPLNDWEEKSVKTDGGRYREKSRVHFSVNTQSGPDVSSEYGAKLLIDGAGYEISFLRSQLHQVEAAYNAKCIRLHELQQESNRFATELESLEERNRQQNAKINELSQQVDGLTREAERWKRRANEININEKAHGGRGPTDQTRRMQASQYVELKREYTHMSQLWRETEKSLQETRRSLESAEKENRVSHRYLTDAFSFIERLERRIKRRDDFIEKLKLQQDSMEERYEKILWCLNELQTLRGQHSYVDYLLSENNVWSMFLFSRLQCRLASVGHVDEVAYDTSIPLYFRRTAAGGKLADAYSPQLVYRLITEHVQGKRRGLPVANDTFPFAVPCWRGMHSISYFSATGGNRTPNTSIMLSGELTHDRPRRSLPLLTLATVLLPPQNGAAPGEVIVDEDIPNSGQYDQLTLRYLIYCFWGERLTQYKRETERRREEYIAAREKAAALDISVDVDIESGANDMDESIKFPTFLAALVEYVRRLCPYKAPKGEEESAPKLVGPVFVRGVVLNLEGAPANPRMCLPFIFQKEENGSETPVPLSPQARELLFALYYYAEEYKDVDSDFRLFHLVAHQQLPELVAINFYASMEAMRTECDNVICESLRGTRNAPEDKTCDGAEQQCPDEATTELLFTDSPAETLRKVAVMVDEAPLAEEDTCMEADSDGEGYGVILPGAVGENEGNKEKQEAGQEPTPCYLTKLKHDILACLNRNTEKPEASATNTSVRSPKADDTTETSDALSVPKQWKRIDEKLQHMLAPFSSLLHAFKKYKERRSLGGRRCDRHKARCRLDILPGSRSLIAIETFIAILHKHCFATYALSCSGSVRFSLLDAAMKGGHGGNDANDVGPFTRVGQLPPMNKHIRRLRFAIAMDQPSSLLRYTDLFTVDSRFGTPSHFHNEYLRLTIDTYLEQQEAYMNVILGSCVVRDGRTIPTPVVDSDGILPFPALRAGFEAVLRKLSFAPKESNIVAKHFLNYCDLLRHEDDIRQEQYVDAPLVICAEVVSKKDFARESALLREHSWSVEDEAASCSLLHLSLAARMMYIVWGLNSSSKGRLAISMLPGAARSFVNAGCTIGGQLVPSESSDSAEGLCPLREDLEPLFRFEVEEECRDALNRAKVGYGRRNELRQLLMETEDVPTTKATESSAAITDVREVEGMDPWELLVDIGCFCPLFGARLRPGTHSLHGEATSVCSRKTRTSKRVSPRPSSCDTDAPAGAIHLSGGASLLRFFGARRAAKTKGDKRKSKNRRNSQELPGAVFAQVLRSEVAPVHYQSILENLAAVSSEANASVKCVVDLANATSLLRNPHVSSPHSASLQQQTEVSNSTIPESPASRRSRAAKGRDGHASFLDGSEQRAYSPLAMSSSDKSELEGGDLAPSSLARQLHVASAVLSLL